MQARLSRNIFTHNQWGVNHKNTSGKQFGKCFKNFPARMTCWYLWSRQRCYSAAAGTWGLRRGFWRRVALQQGCFWKEFTRKKAEAATRCTATEVPSPPPDGKSERSRRTAPPRCVFFLQCPLLAEKEAKPAQGKRWFAKPILTKTEDSRKRCI